MSFSNETAVKSVRKRCQCCACCGFIEVGEPAIRWAGMVDGDFNNVAYHVECRKAEIAFNDLHGTFGDEWCGLSDIDHDDHEWLIAEHPIVAARLGVKKGPIHERHTHGCADRGGVGIS